MHGGPSEAQIRLNVCARQRDERKEGYSAFFERCRRNKNEGKRQEQCGLCGLWLWPEDRCVAFYAAKTVSE